MAILATNVNTAGVETNETNYLYIYFFNNKISI